MPPRRRTQPWRGQIGASRCSSEMYGRRRRSNYLILGIWSVTLVSREDCVKVRSVARFGLVLVVPDQAAPAASAARASSPATEPCGNTPRTSGVRSRALWNSPGRRSWLVLLLEASRGQRYGSSLTNTPLIVTHSMQQAARVADKTAFLYVDTT